jgi:hypothetical protein
MSETTMDVYVIAKEHLSLSSASDERLDLARIKPETLYAWGEQLNHDWSDFEWTIKNSSLWWVGDEMTDLISVASPNFPPHVLEKQHVVDVCGVAMFSHPIPSVGIVNGNKNPNCISAISWTPGTVYDFHTEETHESLNICSWTRVVDDNELVAICGKWVLLGTGSWIIGQTQGQIYEGDLTKQSLVIEQCTQLMTLWTLATQPGIAKTTERQLTRHERKRSERSGATISPIKIVNVRGLRSESGHGEAQSNVEWSHRWLVGGHWRNQPFGPERAQRRPVWVAPYVKGPADKPLVVKETIKVLK